MRRTLALAGIAVLGVTGLAGPASADPGAGIAAFDGIVVNEVAAELDNASGPSGPLSGGFIELLNTTSSPVPVGGWKVEGCTATTTFDMTIVGGTSIGPGDVYVIADPSYTAALGPIQDADFPSGTFEQAAGGVRLLDATAPTPELEDQIRWNDPATLCDAAPDAGVDPTDLQSIHRDSPTWRLDDPTPTLP